MSEKDSARPGDLDPQLLARAQSGDRQAVDRLFSDHLSTVHRFALRMCRDPERARDVAQESLLTALRVLDSYRGEASFSTWLFTIARSHCGKLKKRADREPLSDEPDVLSEQRASAEPTPDEQALHGELSYAVELGLGALEAEDREVVLLRDVEGLSTRDAAQVLGISVAALKSRLHRARAQLREAVQNRIGAHEAPPDAQCPDILTAFSQKLEGDLPENLCARLEQHVRSCPSCAARCDSIQQVLGACALLRSEGPSDEVRRVLDQTLKTYHGPHGV